MRGRIGVVAVVGAMAVVGAAIGAGTPAVADTAGSHYRQDDYADGQAMYVLPPGENGLVNADRRAPVRDDRQAARRPATTSSRQYANLLYGAPDADQRQADRLLQRRVLRGAARRTSRAPRRPAPGVTIYRDKHDVPHIYGDTNPAAAFGAGYAQAEDRLFMMDVLRHYGAGTLASFLGAVLRVRADGPRPAAARAVHARPRRRPRSTPCPSGTAPTARWPSR